MDSIKWTRDRAGSYFSGCGNYEIARTLGGGATAVSEPWWVSYYKGSDGWRRVAGRMGSRTLAQAKAACQRHADTAEVAA
jgi:hypothetical protein